MGRDTYREELTGDARQDSVSSSELGTRGADGCPGEVCDVESFITIADDDYKGKFFLAVR